jgi:hypothetical protein
MRKPKPKPRPSEDFQAACSLWQMESGCYSFEAARAGIHTVLELKLTSDSVEYYPLVVGIICLYARPFTNNRPVGPLAEEIVPDEHRDLHDTILGIRHKLFAHSDASVVLKADDYLNDVVIKNDGKTLRAIILRFAIEPGFLEQMIPLIDALIKKTNYHRLRFARKLKNRVLPLGIGEFRLNVLDPEAPLFSRLTETQKLARGKSLRRRSR